MTDSEKNEFTQMWEAMSPNQQKFAVARVSGHPTDASAAKSIGISPSTVRGWPNRKEVDRAISLMINNQRETATAMLEAAVPQAISVLLDLLADAKAPRVRQLAAIDVLDRVLGKAVQRVAPTNIDGTQSYSPGVTAELDDRQLARIEELMAAARARRLAHEQAIEASVRVLDGPADEDIPDSSN
jgi:hypothetical protein